MGVLDGADYGRRADDRAGSPGRGFSVGRVRELAAVAGLAGEVAAGVGGVLLVSGEQGIGKSALLRAGLSGAERRGTRVVWGTADELDQMFPLRFIRRSLAEAAAGLPRADSGPVGGDTDQLLPGGIAAGDPVRAGVERVLAIVDRLCAVSPVVLVAEDLQWADKASLEVWRRLSGAVGQLPLLLVGSFRPESGRDELEELRREVAADGGTAVELGPLPAAEVAELAAGVLGARPGQQLAELAGRAGGNPLYVLELLDALVRDGRLAVEGGVAELAGDPGGLPQTLAAAIADRLGGLPGEMLRVLRCAAVLGQEFALADLGLVAGMPAAEVTGITEQAVAAGVLAEAGIGAGDGAGEKTNPGEGVLGFRHGLIRQAVYDQIPVPVRGPLHGQAARALAGAGAPAEQVAAQLVAASGEDEWEAGWLAAAAPDLVYRAPGVAAQLLRRTLGWLPSLDPRREAIEVGLLTAAVLLLDSEEVEWVARRLLARTIDPDLAAEISWRVARMPQPAHRGADRIELVEQALARPGTSDAWVARLRGRIAIHQIALGQLDQGRQAARQALAVAERSGDRLAVAYALHVLIPAVLALGDMAAALVFTERALDALRDEPLGTDIRLPLMSNRSAMLAATDRLDESGTTLKKALAVAELTGTPRLGQISVALADYYFMVGQWDDALTVLEAVTVLKAVTVPLSTFIPVNAHGKAALIAAHRDDWDAADQHLAVVQDADLVSLSGRLVSYDEMVSFDLLLARALAAERAGDRSGAMRTLAVCLDPKMDEMMTRRYRVLPSLARLAAAAGDTETVRAAAAMAGQDAALMRVPSMAAAADVCRGLAESDPELLLAAAGYFESTGRPLERAEALEEAAVLLAGQGTGAAARRALADAATGYEALGAFFDLRRADSRLRAHGVRQPYPGRRRDVPASGWAALTGTERVIARLVGQGLSNPDIAAELVLSRSTVQTHVSHILAKLGARSRADIVRHALHI